MSPGCGSRRESRCRFMTSFAARALAAHASDEGVAAEGRDRGHHRNHRYQLRRGPAALIGDPPSSQHEGDDQEGGQRPAHETTRGLTVMKTWPCKGPRLRRVDIRMEPTPFHEGLWASVGGRFLTSGQYPHHPVVQRWMVLHACCVPAGGMSGHSGGSAPDSHRTSLDHRPYERRNPTRAPPHAGTYCGYALGVACP